MLRVPKIRALTGRPRLRLGLVLGAAVLSLVALAVAAQAEILPLGEPTSVANLTGSIKTHTNADYEGAKAPPFSIPCNGCHVPHKAGNANLLRAEGAAICGTCHNLNTIHMDPATQQSVSAAAVPGDCLGCHPHSSGFMPAFGAVSVTVRAQAVGYDDLDKDENLSPGDRVHYRIDYGNRGPEEVTGALLHSELDEMYVASVDKITGGGTFGQAAFQVQWDIGTLAAGASGYVTYDVVLKGDFAFGGAATSSAEAALQAIGGFAGTHSLTTTTTTTTEQAATVIKGSATETEDSATEIQGPATVTDDPATVNEGPATETSSQDSTTTTTAATTATTAGLSAAGSTYVITRVVLTAENREPVSTSVVISVVTDGSSTTSTSVPRKWGTTTTAPTTSTTIAAGPNDVVNTAVLSADDREPLSRSVVFSVVVPGSASTTSTTSPKGEGGHETAPPTSEIPVTEDETSTAVSDEPAASQGEAEGGHGDLDEGGNQKLGDYVRRHSEDGDRGDQGHSVGQDIWLDKQAVGYYDLDKDGHLSPGDRVHYRIEYGNSGAEDVTGVLLRDEPDKAHVASVEEITGGGTFDGTAFQIQWDIGTLAPGASGFVTYDVVLQGDQAFDDGATAKTKALPANEDPATTDSLTTTTSTTTEDPGTETAPEEPATESSAETPTSESSPTTTSSPAPGQEATGVPLAALAVLPLAGATIRRFSKRMKGRRRGPKPPERS